MSDSPQTRREEAEHAFLESEACATEAWDEARDQMPDHITEPVITWFTQTSRYATVFEDWLRGD